MRCDMSQSLVREYYAAFNERRISDASALFALDATVEHLAFAQTFRGPDAYTQFAELWLRAFPDAVLRIDHIEPRGDTICEVDLIAEGTHVGILELGPFGSLKPSGQRMAIRVRELLELRGRRIGYSCLSFDTQAFIRQLAHIDYAQLTAHIGQLHKLCEDLGQSGDPERRRSVTEQIGRELDAARLVVRPWFRDRDEHPDFRPNRAAKSNS
jgi:predicted ester cyclase